MKASLSRNLLIILATVSVLVWIAVAVVVWVRGTLAIERQIDNQLRLLALTIAHSMKTWSGTDQLKEIAIKYDIGDVGDFVIIKVEDISLPMYFNVYENGRLVAIRENSVVFPEPKREGIEEIELNDKSHWRIIKADLGYEGRWLVGGIETKGLKSESNRLLWASLLPIAAGFILLLVGLYVGIRRGLRPLKKLAYQISMRSSEDLQAVDEECVPVEVQPIVSELNGLFGRVSATLDKEKQLTANAAHELQTPLAAIKTEVHLAKHNIPEEFRPSLHRIQERVDRASHTVKQLIALSRLESTDEVFSQIVDLRRLIDKELESHRFLADKNNVSFRLEGDSCSIRGNEDMLAILLDNVIRNAVLYTDKGAEILITLSVGEAVYLTVINPCSPIPKDEMEQLTQRFYRVPGSAASGAGLGYSIISRVCQLHEATLSVSPDVEDKGFKLRIQFPSCSSSD